MYLLRITSLIFALGLMVAKLFAEPIAKPQENWGNDVTRTFPINDFKSIKLEGTYKVILEQGLQPGLQIKTDESNFKYIDVNSDSQTLSLAITKKHFDFDELILYITFKELENLVIEGGISLETKGYVDLKDFDVHVEGGACIDMDIKANKVKFSGQGGVNIELNGIANEVDATISGAGYFDAIDLKSKKCEIKIEGVGAGCVDVSEELNASISGVGKIRYKGDPKVFKKIDGIGLISNE